MTEATVVAKQRVTQALGDLAGRFTVKVRPCHFEISPLAAAIAVVTIRSAGPCADLDSVERAVTGMHGLVYLVQQKYEVWLYVNAEAQA